MAGCMSEDRASQVREHAAEESISEQILAAQARARQASEKQGNDRQARISGNVKQAGQGVAAEQGNRGEVSRSGEHAGGQKRSSAGKKAGQLNWKAVLIS